MENLLLLRVDFFDFFDFFDFLIFPPRKGLNSSLGVNLCEDGAIGNILVFTGDVVNPALLAASYISIFLKDLYNFSGLFSSCSSTLVILPLYVLGENLILFLDNDVADFGFFELGEELGEELYLVFNLFALLIVRFNELEDLEDLEDSEEDQLPPPILRYIILVYLFIYNK